jgi:hypothetical protein
MPNESEQDPERAERFVARLTRRLVDQAADLARSGEVPPSTVATVYLDAAVALALLAGTSPRDVAEVLRYRADHIEQEGGGAKASRN